MATVATAVEINAAATNLTEYAKKCFTHLAKQGGFTADHLQTLAGIFDETSINACVETIKADSEAFVYQGFSPALTLKLLIAAHIKMTEKKSGVPSKEVVGFNVSDFNEAMSYAIALFLTRGTNWPNIKKRSTARLVKIMDHLSGTYSIRATKPKPDDGAPEPKVITLARISAALPHITVSLFKSNVGRTLVPEDKYQLEDAPRVLLSPNVASLLVVDSSEPKGFTPHHVVLWVNYLNDKVLHSKDKKFTEPRQLVQYHSAAFNSTATDVDFRKSFCKKFDLTDASNKYLDSVVKADARCLVLLNDVPGGIFKEVLPIS
uniref:Nucleocapsid protein n=1 Tax=Hubei bunya-like virus 2 TaxID=1922847 RepID=A0A1L3KPG3_9VIRU|nr:hypothetical protein [Hubei bunya-like virus 2]